MNAIVFAPGSYPRISRTLAAQPFAWAHRSRSQRSPSGAACDGPFGYESQATERCLKLPGLSRPSR